ncbi:hypothetical protein F2Q69_00000131 [Brassica cretica]|uniref:Uncharacterized protein n=1 Tax=Brassica cretica TaxID=69181 RepID=A0A8S9P8D5_BRACR|nr:hypothetical protein F2Q69_00000131 [Brassica cretica]
MGLDGAEASHKIHHPVLMHLSAFISLETKARVLRRSCDQFKVSKASLLMLTVVKVGGSRDDSFWVLEKVCSHGLVLQQSLISGSLGSNLVMSDNRILCLTRASQDTTASSATVPGPGP